jgi:hypothetical protein
MRTDLAPTFAPLLDAMDSQLTAVQTQLTLLRTLLAVTVEVTAGSQACQHGAIVRSAAIDREDEYFCGDCGMQLRQKGAEG